MCGRIRRQWRCERHKRAFSKPEETKGLFGIPFFGVLRYNLLLCSVEDIMRPWIGL